MLEIELKYRTDDWPRLQEQLRQRGGTADRTFTERDLYLKAPDRDFKQTDEVLRIRILDESHVWVTYKGPKTGGVAKTRREIETPIAFGPTSEATTRALFESLGYKPVATVTKTRATWSLTHRTFAVHVCFDDVTDAGRFVEVEILANECELLSAQQAVAELAAELGLTTPEPRAYLRMVLDAKGGDA